MQRRRRLHSAIALVSLASLAALTCGCGEGAAVQRAQRDVDRVRKELAAERANVARLRKQIAGLEGQVASLRQRLKPFEQRAGLAPFSGGTISRANGAPLETIAGVRVEGAQDRGKKQALGKHLAEQRGAVIGFWATWCKPCIADEELAHMKKMRAQLKPYGVDFVSVLIDDLGKAQSHTKASQWLYPLWFVKDGHMNMLPRSMVQRVGLGLPFFLVVDRRGAIRWFHKGKLEADTVRDLVTAAARL